MGKRYKSVQRMVHALSSRESAKQFDEHSRRTQLSRILFVLRNRRELTQKDLAEKMGCTQGKISKLEHAEIQDIRMGDLLDYLRALNLNLSIRIHETDSAVDAIKYHAFEIKKHLDSLAEIAKKDETIFDRIAEFFGEYLGNTVRLFAYSASRLPQPQRALEATFKFFEDFLVPALPEQTGSQKKRLGAGVSTVQISSVLDLRKEEGEEQGEIEQDSVILNT